MKKCLFIVDDDPSVRESLKKVLSHSGYDVILAADGKEAEEKLNDPQIDLLILDLNMPDRDGWDVLEDASSNHPLLPVIIITGMADQLDTMSIPGIAALMKKPVDVTVMLKRIEELLSETPEARLRRMSASFETETAPSWRVGGNHNTSGSNPSITISSKPPTRE